MKSKRKVWNNKLSVAGERQLLGDNVVLDPNQKTYLNSAKCISHQGKILYIMRDDFLRLEHQSHVWAMVKK